MHLVFLRPLRRVRILKDKSRNEQMCRQMQEVYTLVVAEFIMTSAK